jgi:hypothetical protein
MNWQKLALFVSGLFFGGAVDHLILAVRRSKFTPYGIPVGTIGNWELAMLDGGIAAFLYWIHYRLDTTNG